MRRNTARARLPLALTFPIAQRAEELSRAVPELRRLNDRAAVTSKGLNTQAAHLVEKMHTLKDRVADTRSRYVEATTVRQGVELKLKDFQEQEEERQRKKNIQKPSAKAENKIANMRQKIIDKWELEKAERVFAAVALTAL